MFNKKMLILGASSVLLASGLAGCGGGPAADLTYWCTSVDNDVMKTIVEEFKKDNPDYADKNIALGANFGEGTAYSNLAKDLGAAGDVIFIADDNIRNGVGARLLADLSADQDAIVKSDGADAVAALSVDGKLYGYPYRNDNSPMPFYDADLFSGDNAAKLGSLEGMLEVCKAAGRKFYFDMTDSWYAAALIWAGGGEFSVGPSKKDATVEVIKNNFVAKKKEMGAALKAFKALYNKYKDTWEVSADNGKVQEGFANGSIGVSFLWNDGAGIKAKAKDKHIKVAAWPSLTVDSNVVKLETFQSYKAIVCKQQTDAERLKLAKTFAKYCASKKAQELRLSLEYGPSNLEAQKTEAAKALDFSTKVNEMANENRTHGQAVNTTGDFWIPVKNVGINVVNGIDDGKAGAWGAYASAELCVVGLASQSGFENA